LDIKTVTPTKLETKEPLDDCSHIKILPANGFDLDGVIVMENFKTNELVSLDLKNSLLISLTHNDTKQLFYDVSPDHTKLVYEQLTFDESQSPPDIMKDEIIVADYENRIIRSISVENNWRSVRWFDNEQLMIGLGESELYPLLLFNYSTGAKNILQPDYPGIYDLHPVPDWNLESAVAYDPTLSFVVFPRIHDEDGSIQLALWSLLLKKEISTINTRHFQFAPVWSSKGDFFITVSDQDTKSDTIDDTLLLVNTDGTVNQLINSTSSNHSQITGIKLSPDNNKIAFWRSGTFGFTNDYRLSVLEISTQKLVNYCIQGNPQNSFIQPPIIWSPDSQQLVVENLYSPKKSRIFLVDLTTQQYYALIEDMELLGWLLPR